MNLYKSGITLLACFVIFSYTVVSKNRFTFDDVAFSLMSIVYVGIGFYYFMETRETGLVYIFYSLFMIWATDSGAYFIGKSLGKRKLWPEISPNKTVGGSVGGIICAVIVSIYFIFITNLDINILYSCNR